MLTERDEQLICDLVPKIHHAHRPGEVVVLVGEPGSDRLSVSATEDGMRTLGLGITLMDARVTPDFRADDLATIIEDLDCWPREFTLDVR